MSYRSEYTSLESACFGLKANNATVLYKLAEQLCSIIDPGAELNSITAYVADSNTGPSPKPAITYAELGRYLLAAAEGRHAPVLFEIESATIKAASVMINTDWLTRRIAAANESLARLTALEEPAANQALIAAAAVNASPQTVWIDQPPPMNGAGYKQLSQWLEHQNDQRKTNEIASRLTIELANMRAERDRYAAQAAVLSAENSHLVSSSQLLTNENLSQARTIQAQTIEITRKSEEIERLQSRVSPAKTTNVQVRNLAVRAAKKAAQVLARELWETTEFADLRVGQMAEEVWARMHQTQHAQAMPELDDTVTNWLKEGEIPAGASRPGRPKKKK